MLLITPPAGESAFGLIFDELREAGDAIPVETVLRPLEKPVEGLALREESLVKTSTQHDPSDDTEPEGVIFGMEAPIGDTDANSKPSVNDRNTSGGLSSSMKSTLTKPKTPQVRQMDYIPAERSGSETQRVQVGQISHVASQAAFVEDPRIPTANKAESAIRPEQVTLLKTEIADNKPEVFAKPSNSSGSVERTPLNALWSMVPDSTTVKSPVLPQMPLVDHENPYNAVHNPQEARARETGVVETTSLPKRQSSAAKVEIAQLSTDLPMGSEKQVSPKILGQEFAQLPVKQGNPRKKRNAHPDSPPVPVAESNKVSVRKPISPAQVTRNQAISAPFELQVSIRDKEDTTLASALDPDSGGLLALYPQTRVTGTDTPVRTAHPESARVVVQQIVESMPTRPNQPVEITLNPEELGRVRMILTGNESQISVSIMAERAETTDLMRRNLDILADQYRELGYSDISFTFGGQHQHRDGRRHTQDQFSGPAKEEPASPNAITQSESTTGVDIRV